jgi:hypothetical protein
VHAVHGAQGEIRAFFSRELERVLPSRELERALSSRELERALPRFASPAAAGAPAFGKKHPRLRNNKTK